MKTELWKKYNQALSDAEQESRTSNIIGDYAEDLVAKAIGGELAQASQKGYDVIFHGVKIQVKATRQNIDASSFPKGLKGITSDIHDDDFKKLIGVIFNKKGEILQVIEVSVEEAKKMWSKRKNGKAWIISWGSLAKIAKDYPSHDITDQYRNLVL